MIMLKINSIFEIKIMIATTQTKEKGHYILQDVNHYKTIIGTLNVKDPSSCFIKLSGYCKPQPELDLNESMKMFERRLRRWVDDAAEQLLNGKLKSGIPIIKNVDYSDTHSTSNASRINSIYTYFSVELTFFFNDDFNIKDEDNKDKMTLMLYSLIDYIEEDRNLSFKPTRK